MSQLAAVAVLLWHLLVLPVICLHMFATTRVHTYMSNCVWLLVVACWLSYPCKFKLWILVPSFLSSQQTFSLHTRQKSTDFQVTYNFSVHSLTVNICCRFPAWAPCQLSVRCTWIHVVLPTTSGLWCTVCILLHCLPNPNVMCHVSVVSYLWFFAFLLHGALVRWLNQCCRYR